LGQGAAVTLKQDDANALIRETASAKSVLVGGQAVAFWISYFDIPALLPALTLDIDYLATATEARRAHANLSFPSKLSIATLDSATPNTAMLAVELKGYDQPILVDYLAHIIGPATRQIEQTAVEVEYAGTAIRVIHPLLLLQSKIANLHRLETKRSKEGIEQARLAIAIAAAYVDNLVKSKAAQREILRAVQSISKYAATQPARYVHEHFGLECFEAIPPSALEPGVLPEPFHARQMPRLKTAIARARKAAQTIKSKATRPEKKKSGS
jgi:hypothetical protein